MEFRPANSGTFPESVFASLNDKLNCRFLPDFYESRRILKKTVMSKKVSDIKSSSQSAFLISLKAFSDCPA